MINAYKQKYECLKCGYSTNKLSNWNKHLESIKHNRQLNNFDKNEKSKLEYENRCEFCGKEYKFKSGLSRHLKLCSTNKNTYILINKKEHERVLEKAELYEKQQKDIDFLKESVKELSLRETKPTIINNNVNISIILNDYCKNAMNLEDFIKHINLSVEDLFYTKKNGYIQGVSNIFIKNLVVMEPTLRPIQCSNLKRSQLYIKDNDKWEIDDGIRLNSSINAVTKKHIEALKTWEKTHPSWKNSDIEVEEYTEFVKNIMGGTNDNEREKNDRLIKKKISQNVCIDDIKQTNLN